MIDGAVLCVAQEQAGDVLGERHLDEPDTLGLQGLGKVDERILAQSQTRSLELGQSLALADGVPARAHGRRVVVDVVGAILVDAQELLKECRALRHAASAGVRIGHRRTIVRGVSRNDATPSCAAPLLPLRPEGLPGRR